MTPAELAAVEARIATDASRAATLPSYAQFTKAVNDQAHSDRAALMGHIKIVPPVITPPPSTGGIAVAPPSAPIFQGDPTGQTDVSAALATFLQAGGQRALKPGATYLANQRIQLNSPVGLDLFFQGAQVKSQGFYAPNQPDSWLRIVTGRSIILRDPKIIGPATLADIITNWAKYGWAREDWRGLVIDGGHDITLDRPVISGYWGDNIYIGPRDGSSDQYATTDGLTINDPDLSIAGRNNISITGGKHITINRGKIGNAGLCALDIEPNKLMDVVSDFLAKGTRFYGGDLGKTDSASHDLLGNGYVVMLSAGFAPALRHTLDGCAFDKGAIYSVASSGTRNKDITIINNTADILGDATFARTDGIGFSNNVRINKQITQP